VDGDENVADLTERVLRRFGFRVIAARDGEEAAHRLTADEPDLVLLEKNLARRGGLEVCADIRRQFGTPVIMLTTSDDKEDVLRAFAAGADDYVTKPFSPFQLVASITAVLERRASPQP
jgi:DNA-binding response OmpR family regulator